jgi:hypothetical protein
MPIMPKRGTDSAGGEDMGDEKAKKKSMLVRFYVPMYRQDKEYVSRKERERFIKEIKELTLKANGGFTCYEATGGYLSSNGELVEEPVMVIETIGKNPVSDLELIHFSRGLEQECVMVVEAEQFDLYLLNGEGGITKNGEKDHLRSSFYESLFNLWKDSGPCDVSEGNGLVVNRDIRSMGRLTTP